MAAMPLNSRVGFFLPCRLASHSADAPAGGASCVGSNADTIHSVHSGPACFADSNDNLIRLLKRTFNVRPILLRLRRHVLRGRYNSASFAFAAGSCGVAKDDASVPCK